MEMIKYSKTPRLTKSLGVYDDNYDVVVEEKIDGANCAVSFIDGKLTLQSRGHILTGGKREFLFKRFWPWAYERLNTLQHILGERYILFGEWMYAKNRMYYDNLPDYFIAFDIWDKHNNFFLNTDGWRKKIANSDIETVHFLNIFLQNIHYQSRWENVIAYINDDRDSVDWPEGLREKLLSGIFEKIGIQIEYVGTRPTED